MQAFMGSVMESNMGPVMGSDMGSVMGSVIGLVMGMVRMSQCQKSLLWHHHHSLTTRVRYRAARAASDTNVY